MSAASFPRVLLIGNYRRDGQESMLRFTRMMQAGLAARGLVAEVFEPGVILGRWLPTWSGIGKWLAYIDKYLFFPGRLRWKMRSLPAETLVHVCDHSNAVYVPAAASAGHRVVVTCHDLGAVRGALGEATDCPATPMGRILQDWIARSLGKADVIACDSSATLQDVQRLIRRPDGAAADSRLVLLGLNAPFAALDPEVAGLRLREVPRPFDVETPYVLNVGSSLTRKNRAGVLRIFARSREAAAWPKARLVFAGEALPPDLIELTASLGLNECVTQIVNPSNAILEALYSRAFALLFPSRFEGFGWPAIEAQACGCPVLASDAGSLGEVVGAGGFLRPADAEAEFASELVRLALDPQARAEWVRRGFENVTRFTAETMIGHYVDIYDELAPATDTNGVPAHVDTNRGSFARMIKTLGMPLTVFLPWSLRRWLLQRWWHYELDPTSRIGLSWVFPDRLVMGPHTRIGHLTVCKNLHLVQMEEHSFIGNLDWITGFPLGPSPHFAHQSDRRPELHVGRHAAITHRHLIDCTNTVTIGAYTTFAGFQSQILTHSIDVAECRQTSAPVTIGEYCFVGTNCVLLGGAVLPDRCVLGAKSLLNKAYTEGGQLYGGVPARPLQPLPPEENAYFRRETGFVF